jgi:hypothetical protein
MKFLLYAFFAVCMFTGCASNEIGNSKDVNPQTIFVDYSVLGEENDDSVTCLAQFRFAGENGTTLVLNEPSNIMIDETAVAVDSNDAMGAFYEKKFKTVSFGGLHSWKYIDGETSNYSTAFVFTPFSLKKQLPLVQGRKDSLLIELTGLQDGTVITTELSDTSSKTENVIVKNKIGNGKITIPASAWQNLSTGPVSVRLSNTIDTSLSINERPAEGGHILVNYFLRERKVNLRGDAVEFASKN